MRCRAFVALAIGLLLTLLLRLAPSQAERAWTGIWSGVDGCPAVPNTPRFTIAYGAVLANGSDAPVGTIVEAVSPRGNVVGCFEVTTAGHYGAMYIYGEDTSVNPPIPGMRDSETVTFRVDGVNAAASPPLLWHDDKAPHWVDLSAQITTPTSTPTPSGTPAPTSSPPPTRPDLLVDNIEALPSSPGLNRAIVVTVTIRNQGSAAVTRFFYTDVYADHVPGGCNDFGWSYARTDSLDAGGMAVLTYTHRGFGTAGIHTIYAQVDSSCQVDESDEGNNVFGPLRVEVSDLTPTPTPLPPRAEFEASPRSGPVPLVVQFTDLSTGQIDTWFWEFGDGLTSTVQAPTHTYVLTGTFTISLTITGPGGSDTEVKAGYIQVNEEFRVYLPLVLRDY